MGDAQRQASAPLGVLSFAPSAIQQPADASRDQEQGGGLGHGCGRLQHHERLEIVVPAPDCRIQYAGVAAGSRDIRVEPVAWYVAFVVEYPDPIPRSVGERGIRVGIPRYEYVVKAGPSVWAGVGSSDVKVDARSSRKGRIYRYA